MEPKYWARKGHVEFLLEKYSDAMLSWKKALKLDPKDAKSYSNLGLLHEKMGEKEIAEAAYRNAIDLSPLDADCLARLGAFLLDEITTSSEGLAYIERAIELDRDCWMAWANKGIVLMRQGEFHKAADALETAHHCDSTNIPVLITLVKCLIEERNFVAARRYLSFIKNLSPSDPNVTELEHKLNMIHSDDRLSSQSSNSPTVGEIAERILVEVKAKGSEKGYYRGNKALLQVAQNLQEAQIAQPYQIRTTLYMGMAYDIFGLPNGKKNPTHGSNHPTHALMAPTDEELHLAFKQVILPLLSPEERWVLEIPLGFTELLSIDAKCYVNATNGCAILLNAGLFSGLFAANERLFLFRSKNKVKQQPISLEELSNLLAYFFIGSGEIPDYRYFHTHDFVDPQLAYAIWQASTIQQVFILLHEYGHLCSTPIPSKDDTKTALSVLKFSDYSDEKAADQWAASHMAVGIPGVTVDDQIINQALFDFFAFLQLLKVKAPNTGMIDPVGRWLNICPILAPSILSTQIYEKYIRMSRIILEKPQDYFGIFTK